MRRFITFLLGSIIIVLIFLVVTGYFFRVPSSDRNWSADQLLLPTANIAGNQVTISNIRNFSYSDKDTFIPAYYTKTYDLDTLLTVDYVVEQFSGIGAAHTFLSFGFTDGSYVAISAEIRKEVGEKFSPWLGVLRHYELMYVIADERDVIGLRANYRHDPVYVYPTTATPAEARTLFLGMVQRANAVHTTPEFYNTFTNTCTTNIAWHINQLMPGKIPFDLRFLFPSNSDRMAYELGLLDTRVSLEHLRATYLVNDRATTYATAPDFSQKIRGL